MLMKYTDRVIFISEIDQYNIYTCSEILSQLKNNEKIIHTTLLSKIMNIVEDIFENIYFLGTSQSINPRIRQYLERIIDDPEKIDIFCEKINKCGFRTHTQLHHFYILDFENKILNEMFMSAHTV